MAPRELDLLQGTLDVLVLRALSFGPMHGYAVARFIRAGSDGSFKVLDELWRLSRSSEGII